MFEAFHRGNSWLTRSSSLVYSFLLMWLQFCSRGFNPGHVGSILVRIIGHEATKVTCSIVNVWNQIKRVISFRVTFWNSLISYYDFWKVIVLTHVKTITKLLTPVIFAHVDVLKPSCELFCRTRISHNLSHELFSSRDIQNYLPNFLYLIMARWASLLLIWRRVAWYF